MKRKSLDQEKCPISRALDVRQRQLGADHLDTLTTMYEDRKSVV